MGAKCCKQVEDSEVLVFSLRETIGFPVRGLYKLLASTRGPCLVRTVMFVALLPMMPSMVPGAPQVCWLGCYQDIPLLLLSSSLGVVLGVGQRSLLVLDAR